MKLALPLLPTQNSSVKEKKVERGTIGTTKGGALLNPITYCVCVLRGAESIHTQNRYRNLRCF